MVMDFRDGAERGPVLVHGRGGGMGLAGQGTIWKWKTQNNVTVRDRLGVLELIGLSSSEPFMAHYVVKVVFTSS